jgi:hypothetical protein
MNDRKEWGPGPDMTEAGLHPVTHEDAVIEAEYGVAMLRFKADRALDLMHSLHSNQHSKEQLADYVVHHRDGDDVIIDVKLPTLGEYALNLFAKDSDVDGKLANVCSYLLTSDQGAFDERPFPTLPNGFAGVTKAGRQQGVRCVSHKTALIEAPESGELNIDLKLPKNFSVLGKLAHRAAKGCRDLDKYLMTTVDQKDKARFSMRLPEAGFYSLKVFGSSMEGDTENLANVYNFLIHVPTPKGDCTSFPTTYSSFRDKKCRVEAPLTGTLPANESIPFGIHVPGAKDVVAVSSKGWQHLIKCDDGTWRGNADTGDPGTELTVAAKLEGDTSENYTSMLTYGASSLALSIHSHDFKLLQVEQAKEIVKQTEVQQTNRLQAKKRQDEEKVKRQERGDDVARTHQGIGVN